MTTIILPIMVIKMDNKLVFFRNDKNYQEFDLMNSTQMAKFFNKIADIYVAEKKHPAYLQDFCRYIKADLSPVAIELLKILHEVRPLSEL